MAVQTAPPGSNQKPDLVRLAGDALPLSENSGGNNEQSRRPYFAHDTRPAHQMAVAGPDRTASKPLSAPIIPQPRFDRTTPNNESVRPRYPDPKLSRAATDGLVVSRSPEFSTTLSRPRSRSPLTSEPSRSPSQPPRSNTVPGSLQASSQTLPPLQPQSSISNLARSPNNQESLPSLEQQNLKPLMNSKPPTDSRYNDTIRGQIPVTSSIGSPNALVKTAKPVQSYPSPQSRISSAFPITYNHGHPSPVHSDASPRDTIPRSPQEKPGPLQFAQSQQKTPGQSEELTPQSANSYPSSSTFSTATSPQQGDSMDIERSGRMLPPLIPHPGPPLMTGTFKCDYSGCNAAPFQTQYLLKYVNAHQACLHFDFVHLPADSSHANVHSQKRPHYCPVSGCNRGEGGKGFKRKNEMIRHGLVHDSPGYICPFCPEREHKYPRPDNLQRYGTEHSSAYSFNSCNQQG